MAGRCPLGHGAAAEVEGNSESKFQVASFVGKGHLLASYTNGFWNVGPEHGFLPMRHPLARLPSPTFDVLQALLSQLPAILAAQDVAARVEALPSTLLDDVLAQDDVFVQAALYRGLTFLSSGFLLEPAHHALDADGKYGKARTVLPAILARPLTHLAKKLGVHPYLDYHYAYSLGNYIQTVPEFDSPSGAFDQSNLQMAVAFSGGPDERGFIMLHVDIDSHSPALLESVYSFVDKPSVEALQRGHQAMQTINARRRLMWQASDPKRYNDFRAYIMGITGNVDIFGAGVVYEGCFDNAPQAFRGQSGSQDDIIPTMDIFTGCIGFYPDNELTSFLLDMRQYRPAPVREFFVDLESLKLSMASFEAIPADGEHMGLVYLLGIVDQIYIFRSGHWQFVQRYIMANTKHPTATGGTPIISWLPNQIKAVLSYQTAIIARIEEVGGGGAKEHPIFFELRGTLESKKRALEQQLQELHQESPSIDNVFALNTDKEC